MGHKRRPRHVESFDRPTGPFEPTARQLDIYYAYTEGLKTLREVGKEFGISHETVRTTVNQVDGWLRPQYMDEINLLRTRHTVRLESMFAEAIKAWRASREDVVETSETTNPDSSKSTVRKVRQQSGNPALMKAAIEALRDIRSMWGVDKAPPVPPSGKIRVAGKTPDEVAKELQKKLLDALGVSEN